MKIQIWSDYACPYCYIGERQLQIALERTGINEDVEIEFKAFELNPNAPKTTEFNIDQLMASKYGLTLDQAVKTNQRIIDMAASVGLNYNFEHLKPTNTFDAHRLAHYAKTQGKLHDYVEIAMRSYFTDSKNISEYEVLLAIGVEAGLKESETIKVLSSNVYENEVRKDESDAYARSISGVPYFIFDEKAAVYGAQPIENFMKVIESVKAQQ